jgi:hypothetical protein
MVVYLRLMTLLFCGALQCPAPTSNRLACSLAFQAGPGEGADGWLVVSGKR